MTIWVSFNRGDGEINIKWGVATNDWTIKRLIEVCLLYLPVIGTCSDSTAAIWHDV